MGCDTGHIPHAHWPQLQQFTAPSPLCRITAAVASAGRGAQLPLLSHTAVPGWFRISNSRWHFPTEGKGKELKLRNNKQQSFLESCSWKQSINPVGQVPGSSSLLHQSKNRDAIMKWCILIFKRTVNDFRVYIPLIAMSLFTVGEELLC